MRCPFFDSFHFELRFQHTSVLKYFKILPNNFCCLFRSSFQFYSWKKSNILHLYDDPFLPTHNFSSSRCHVGLKTIIVYNRAKTENIKSTKPEKSQRIIRWILILLIIENRLYFLFLISILQKKDVSAAIFCTHLKHATVRCVLSYPEII